MNDLDRLGEVILARLDDKSGHRERVLAMSRQLVQHAARSIRAAHRGEWDEADAILAEADLILRDMTAAAAGHADLMSAGYTLDAQKEHAEAHLVRALVRGEPLPAPEALGVDDASWLNGLGEAGGELRRAALDRIRRGDVVEAERFLDRLQDIYVFLSTVDYPDAITRGLKRTNDMVRGVAERTRGDLTVAVRQEELKAALDRFEARVAGGVAGGEPGGHGPR
jgi:translin